MNLQTITAAQVAIFLSALSLAVSFTALGWNIYKELGLKARIKVAVSVIEMIYAEHREKRVMFYVVNFGPGAVFVTSLTLKKSWWQRRRSEYKTKFYSLIAEDRTASWDSLPIKLDVGQQGRFVVPYDAECFLKEKHSRAGVMDSFERYHWARRKRLRRAEKQYEKDFGRAT